MWIYFILLLLMPILWQSETEKKSSKNAFFIYLCILLLFAFRDYKVGNDTESYIYEYMMGPSYDRSIDFGFAKYNQLLRWLGFSPRLFLIVSSLIICFPVFLYINKMSTPKMFSFILYVTIGTSKMHLTGMRQAMADNMVRLLEDKELASLLRKKWMDYVEEYHNNIRCTNFQMAYRLH